MQNLLWMRLVDNVDDSMNCVFMSPHSSEILPLCARVFVAGTVCLCILCLSLCLVGE